MPAILVQLASRALQLLGVTAGGAAIERIAGIDIPFIGPGQFGANGVRRRRRRRKALTGDDLRIALTLASAISKKAAENFILQRVRAT